MLRRCWAGFCAVGVLGAAAAGCVSPVDEDDSKVPASCQQDAPLAVEQKTDILFVIDNSGSMAEEQAKIADELPAFVSELKQGAGTGHDFQVGVITTAVYQNALLGGATPTYSEYTDQAGKLQRVPDAAGAPTEQRLLKGDDPALVEKFARLVKQGTTGSGQETPFEAVRLAVATELATTPQAEGGNAGFLRDDARLLVVVVSDEDDCSEQQRPPAVFVGTDKTRDYCSEQASRLTKVGDYAAIFKGLKDSTGALRQVLWATIGPVGLSNKEAKAVVEGGSVHNVDCPDSFGPGYRQKEMALQFDATLGNLTSICASEYRESLLAIAQIANAAQSIEVQNVPDPRLLKVEITRSSGEVVTCTLANGGITYDPPTDGGSGHVLFTAGCPRKFDDTAVQLKLICAG